MYVWPHNGWWSGTRKRWKSFSKLGKKMHVFGPFMEQFPHTMGRWPQQPLFSGTGLGYPLAQPPSLLCLSYTIFASFSVTSVMCLQAQAPGGHLPVAKLTWSFLCGFLACSSQVLNLHIPLILTHCAGAPPEANVRLFPLHFLISSELNIFQHPTKSGLPHVRVGTPYTTPISFLYDCFHSSWCSCYRALLSRPESTFQI